MALPAFEGDVKKEVDLKKEVTLQIPEKAPYLAVWSPSLPRGSKYLVFI